jgi:hypothetical protein
MRIGLPIARVEAATPDPIRSRKARVALVTP